MRLALLTCLALLVAGCSDDSAEPAEGPTDDVETTDATDGNATADNASQEMVREDLLTTELAADFGYDVEPAGCEGLPLLAAGKMLLGDDPLSGTDHDTFEVEQDWWGANVTFTAAPGPDVTLAWVDPEFDALEIHRVAGGETLNTTIPDDTDFGGYAPCEPEPSSATVEVFRLVPA